MLSLEQVNAEIEKLENDGRMNSKDCADLANLYMIRDKLEHKSKKETYYAEPKHYHSVEMPAKETVDLTIYPGKEKTHFTQEMADEWTSHMENEDGTVGPHWTLKQAKEAMASREIDGSPIEFWVALNATYSDLCKVFKKYGIGNLDAYVDFAEAFWLDDKDAQPDKLARYYEYIVK